jgi:hypothetical protein
MVSDGPAVGRAVHTANALATRDRFRLALGESLEQRRWQWGSISLAVVGL